LSLAKTILTEDKVTTKITELMQTLDQVKKYKAIAKFLPKFALIIGSTLGVFFALLTLFEILELEHLLNTTMFLVVAFLSLLIPIGGLLSGMYLMRKKIMNITEGQWKTEIPKGFASTLKILLDMDWDRTFDDISDGRLGYAVYGLIKAGTYLVVIVSAFELLWNGLTLILMQQILMAGSIFWGLIGVLIVVVLLGKDLLRRYQELRALDMLVWELRWFSLEFGRAEFKT
jgi:hypothetical protein